MPSEGGGGGVLASAKAKFRHAILKAKVASILQHGSVKGIAAAMKARKDQQQGAGDANGPAAADAKKKTKKKTNSRKR